MWVCTSVREWHKNLWQTIVNQRDNGQLEAELTEACQESSDENKAWIKSDIAPEYSERLSVATLDIF